MKKVVFFDLETSGLDANKHDVIQFAGVALDEWQEVGAMELKIRFPREHASEEALAVNHFDAAVWAREALNPLHAAQRISKFFSTHADVEKISKRSGRPYWIARVAGHNAASFDGPFLNAFFRRTGVFLPAATYEALDTMHLARWVTYSRGIELKDHRLGTLYEAFCGAPLADAHDALTDVRATARLARELLRRARREPELP